MVLTATTYTFKMNYYWMMGDNRYNSVGFQILGICSRRSCRRQSIIRLVVT